MRSHLAFVFLVLLSSVTVFSQKAGKPKIQFNNGTSTTIPFKIASNLIIMKARVNGSAPADFIFDTGAGSTVIDSEFGEAVGLKKSGNVTSNGAAGRATAGVLKGASVELGDLKATRLTIYSLPLGDISTAFDVRIKGIIGNDIIGRVVADIDYENGRLRLVERFAFRPGPTAERVPITIFDNIPFVRSAVTPLGAKGAKSISALLELDTGSTGALLLNSPFVKKNALIDTLRVSLDHATGGVGGSGSSKVGRIASIRFGSFGLEHPITVFYTGTKGDNASSEYDGLIGGGILRRFKVTIDMLGKSLFLEKASDFGEPFEMDMSGLDLVSDGPDLKMMLVDDVRPDSAGAKAGIQGGDYLTEIDGKRVETLGFDAVKRLLRVHGAQYDLTLTRNGKQVRVKLRLNRVI
jgi:predicted aspartyl protease